MSAETKTERVLRDVLNSDNLRDFLGGDVVNNAMKWRFLRAALIVLDGHGLLGDPDAVKDATPAPLDPKLVHVGDTVTVRFIETGEEITTKAYQPKDLTADSEWVYILGWPLNKPMGHGLAVKYFEILDHQPAPEPEPLVEGRLYEVTAPDGRRGRAFYKPIDGIRANHPWVSEDETRYRSDAVTDVRPLVVIDPAAGWWAEIHNALVAAGIGDAGSAATIALATLGIEATS